MVSTEQQHDSRSVVEEFLRVFSTGDVDETLEFLADDATWWVAGSLEGLSGTRDKDGVREMLDGAGGAAKGGAIALTPTAWTVDGDRVAVEASSHAELLNGRVYANTYHLLFELRDGAIVHVKEFSDTQHVADVFLAP